MGEPHRTIRTRHLRKQDHYSAKSDDCIHGEARPSTDAAGARPHADGLPGPPRCLRCRHHSHHHLRVRTRCGVGNVYARSAVAVMTASWCPQSAIRRGAWVDNSVLACSPNAVELMIKK